MMVFKVLTALLLLLPPFAFSAGPITHILYAYYWTAQKDKELTYEEMRAFILGTLFPDIRYLGGITRAETHQYGLTIADIEQEPSPYKRGKMLHSYLDEKREELVVKWGIYDKIKPWVPEHQDSFLKLLEDEILFDSFHRPNTDLYLTELIPEEEAEQVSKQQLLQWHFILRTFLAMPPHELLDQLAKQNRGFPNISPEMTAQWSVLLETFAQDPEMLTYTQNLIDALVHFD